MRLIWCTDIHLDHCSDIKTFQNDVLTMKPDRILLTGDISNALYIKQHLKDLANAWNCPIDFVLGNHDYYGSSPYSPAKMRDVITTVTDVTNNVTNLNWLSQSGPIELTDNTALIGNGLWCDWRAGLKSKSNVWLNDYQLIYELFGYPTLNDRRRIQRKVRNLAKSRTNKLIQDFNTAIKHGYKKIIIGTHVPPFHEASFYNGVISDDNWAPHFVCKIAGDNLKAITKTHHDIDVTILCGHTHGEGKKDILQNLHVINGAATYGNPAAQMPIII